MATQALDFIPEVTVALTVSQTLGNNLASLLFLLSWLTPLPYRRRSSLFLKAHRAAPHCTFCSHLQYLCFICSDIWGKVETVEPQLGSARITSCKHKYT